MGIAVFASGNGGNFESLIKCSIQEKWEQPISLVISDKPKAKVLERAKKWQVPHYAIDVQTFANKEEFEQEVLQLLQKYQIRWIVLAGYMRLIGTTLLKAYEGQIVNIHPSLLPAFPGKNAIEMALQYPVKITGVTIHYVDEGMDTGPILAQEAIEIQPNETVETLVPRIHAVEHRLYPQVVQSLISEGTTYTKRTKSHY